MIFSSERETKRELCHRLNLPRLESPCRGWWKVNILRSMSVQKPKTQAPPSFLCQANPGPLSEENPALQLFSVLGQSWVIQWRCTTSQRATG